MSKIQWQNASQITTSLVRFRDNPQYQAFARGWISRRSEDMKKNLPLDIPINVLFSDAGDPGLGALSLPFSGDTVLIKNILAASPATMVHEAFHVHSGYTLFDSAIKNNWGLKDTDVTNTKVISDTIEEECL